MSTRDNIVRGAKAGSGANRKRATEAASRRFDTVEGLAPELSDILLRPEVLGLMPDSLASKVKLGDQSAMFEATQYLLKMRDVPQTPANRMLSRLPDLREAGFQMGPRGGRVPVDSAGELIVAPSRQVLRHPGSEAGFQMGGSIPPQTFEPTALSVPEPGAIDVRQTPRRTGGINPLLPGGGLFLAGAAKGVYDALRDQQGVVAAPEERVPQTSEGDQLPPTPPASPPAPKENAGPPAMQKPSELSAMAASMLRERFGKHTENKPPARKPPRPESELWQTQGERSMEYELRPGGPQANTRDALIDAGVEPGRAEGIARGTVAMNPMERQAVIDNSGPRRQRAADQIRQRRDARMGGY